MDRGQSQPTVAKLIVVVFIRGMDVDSPVNEEGIVKGGDSAGKKASPKLPYCEGNRNKITEFTKVSEVGLPFLKSATLMQFEKTVQIWGWNNTVPDPTVSLYSANRGLCKGPLDVSLRAV